MPIKHKKSTKDKGKNLEKLESKIDKFINEFDGEKSEEKSEEKRKNSRKSKKWEKSYSKQILVKCNDKWFKLRNLKEHPSGQVTREREYELMQEAKQLIQDDIELYNRQNEFSSKKADFAWVKTVMKQGTLSDKLAAHTILIQDSPVHNLASISSMIQFVSPKGKRECLMAIDNLRELFIGDLLIPNEKLKNFGQLVCHLGNNESRKRQLILFYFEDQLKQLYRRFIEAVVIVSHDTVDTTKSKSVLTFFDLLVNNPEQEQFLLENLVNKLGDPFPKLASKVCHYLKQLINQHHPVMKEVVVNEVERLLYRPNISQNAQYYCLCFMNEIFFRSEDTQLANKMIGIYFGFFKRCVKEGDVDNKMMSALLSGVTRAFPYSKLETNILQDHLETFYKIIHFVNFNTSIQALLLIFNVLDVNENGFLTDRFYSVLYRHLLEFHPDSCSKKAMFLNLVFRALKRDSVYKRIRAFIKRLMQIALTSSPSVACSILILISELFNAKQNLMLTVINTDQNVLLNEDDEEEKYHDVSDEEDENNESKKEDENNEHKDGYDKSKPSWVHNLNIDTNKPRTTTYDFHARNPLYANAESVVLWELAMIVKNFHPSENLFAQNIIDKQKIEYDGDPLTDFTLKHFLDRFVFRNPKHFNKLPNPVASQKKVFGRLNYKTKSKLVPAMNTKEYVKQSEEFIPLEERFIYSYLKQRNAERENEDESDIESVTSEDFEKILERYEPGYDKEIDFASEFKKGKKKNKKKNDEIDKEVDESEDDDDFGAMENVDDDDEIDFENDEEFNEAFQDMDSDLDNFEDEEAISMNSKYKKKSGDKSMQGLFVSADKFAQILEQNETDSEFSGNESVEDEKEDGDDEEGGDKKDKKFGKFKKTNKKRFIKPKLGRRKKLKRVHVDL